MQSRYKVPETIVMLSCSGVTIKNVHNIAAMPAYLITRAAEREGILFENRKKKIAKPAERKIMPLSAHALAGLSKPFIALAANKLLKKFLVHRKPTEFLS